MISASVHPIPPEGNPDEDAGFRITANRVRLIESDQALTLAAAVASVCSFIAACEPEPDPENRPEVGTKIAINMSCESEPEPASRPERIPPYEWSHTPASREQMRRWHARRMLDRTLEPAMRTFHRLAAAQIAEGVPDDVGPAWVRAVWHELHRRRRLARKLRLT